MRRRSFLQGAASLPALRFGARFGGALPPAPARRPGRIANEYSLWLPGEEASLRTPVTSSGWRQVGGLADGTTVHEQRVSHQGVLVYQRDGQEIARIRLGVGQLASIRPRPVNPSPARIQRPAEYTPGADPAEQLLLAADEDPCYENVAALGAELIGWTLAGNEQSGPEHSLWLEPDGRSRQLANDSQIRWAPDLAGRRFDPRRLLPSEYLYDYVPGYSKRTLAGGFLPVPEIGVWNPRYRLGYGVMLVLPQGPAPQPVAWVRAMTPAGSKRLIPEGDTAAGAPRPQGEWTDRFWNGSAADFFAALLQTWRHWSDFFATGLQADIPDGWLHDAARAGITLARCSYRGLEPTYQIGEGAYTKIPERSHALFPVAHYEFVWAQQAWGLGTAVEPYFQHYLDRYILPSGDFVYNTQDQVESPLNAGVFLSNSARAFEYTRDRAALQRRLPTLQRMTAFALARAADSRRLYPPDDPRHGLIWGSPEADMGDPKDNTERSHPYYFQNTAWLWRGLHDHARALRAAGMGGEAEAAGASAVELRRALEASLRRTAARGSPAMRAARITPFTTDDTHRDPRQLSSYENHRYMMDWWTCDWGDAELDLGHFRHRALAGQQMLGMNLDGDYPRTSNFMEHGTLSGRIRQDDYRLYLLALYGNLCFAMDSGSRYAPEDALLPGNYPGEGSPYAWSAVVNSTLQPTLGLRWLLCWEDGHRDAVHLQKAAPRHWFAAGRRIAVRQCPTRFGRIAWSTEAISDTHWRVRIEPAPGWNAEIVLHIHPPGAFGTPLRSASVGHVNGQTLTLAPAELTSALSLEIACL